MVVFPARLRVDQLELRVTTRREQFCVSSYLAYVISLFRLPSIIRFATVTENQLHNYFL